MNSWRIFLLSCLLLAGFNQSVRAAEPDKAGIEFFEKRIRPVLVEYCYECHSQKSKIPKGGLLIDTRKGLLTGGDSGAGLVPGEPDESLIIEALRYGDDAIQMPPLGKLPDTVIADFVKWIELGAPDPRLDPKPAPKKSDIDFGAGRKFWSFRPPQRHTPRIQGKTDWVQQPIDGFILARLQEKKLTPSPSASREVLIRRAYYDLLGLPPTPEEIARFVNDKKPRAYERLIEQLLDSPHYGERWGRYWLDLTRYTDSTASWLRSTGKAWLYRDWVVEALNDDMPYDEFVRRQLATDMMPQTGPDDSPALGFIGLSPTYWKELKLDKDVIKVVVAEEWEERIDALGRTFLGLSLACARCHDHKFDPVSMQDYYALAGVFASSRLVDRAVIPEPAAAVVRKARERIKPLELEIKKLEVKKPQTDEVKQQLAKIKAQIQEIKRTTPHFDSPIAHGIADESIYVLADGPNKTKLQYKPGVARDLHVHIRGNPAKPGPLVKRRFLSVFSPSTSTPPTFQQGSGRLELANAIVGQGAPLASRVIVNRVWRHHFGRGLVDTLSDFGSQGARPSHGQLLDDLAARFIANGWSFKWLHRQIMLSATYRQASDHRAASHKLDPDNRWLWRMNRRRLDIESWRDAMLAVSGSLDPKLGGPSIALDSPKNNRRTIYGNINRRDLNGMLRLYDFPDPTSHSPGRVATTTPLQQLFVLNGPFIQSQAAALAKRLQVPSQDKKKGEATIRQAYRLLYGRHAENREVQYGIAYLTGPGTDQPNSSDRWHQYFQVLLGNNEFMFID